MPHCLDLGSWRLASRSELIEFMKRKSERKGPHGDHLVIRTQLKQADVYAYLRARFGQPNGFQNFLRRDDSDNLVHWDFNLKANGEDVYLQGVMRNVSIILSETISDDQWKELILAIKADYARIGRTKSEMMRSFEKYVVFQNKFVVLANLCGELHASIVDAPKAIRRLPKATKKSAQRLKAALNKASKRATNLYGDCLKLRLLTPIMAEAFLNMVIVCFCRDTIRNDKARYDEFLRAKMPEKLKLLSVNCFGFERAVDRTSEAYKGFMRVMNTRNFAIHGNVDPMREQVEVIFFEGKRPLFVENGDHLLALFEHLEQINAPRDVIADYEAVHMFLTEITGLLGEAYRTFFEPVINDPYPGYEVNLKRVTKILPSHTAAMLLQGERYDDDLRVTW